MGANQSSGTSKAREIEEEVKTCYYELLGVEKQASNDEIKKAYREKALKLHPDRNYGNVGQTTKRFAEIQVAYEILSDVQERAWYDLHTDAILGNQQGPSNGYYEYGTRITTAEDIVRLFTRLDERLEFSDGPSGFYTTIRELFDELAREEEIACQRAGLGAVDYPSFGSAKDSYENVVRPFYVIWSGFATKKSFNCKDRFRYSDAPDRCARRMMEKENKKLRGESVREFNDSIRSLVAFIKRRDPRYLSNRQSDSERQKALREQAASQAARARAENQAKLDREVVPEWANIQAPAENEMEEDLVDDEPLQHFECVVCDKTFKSEKQYNTHEKSRKHTKAIQYFRRIMKSEDVTLGHDTPRQISLAIPINEVAKKEYVKNRVSNRNIDNEESSSGHKPAAKPTAKTVVNQNDDLYIVSSVESDDEYALREIVTERIFHDATAEIDVNKLSQGLIIKTVEDQDTQTNRVKPGKAKMKRAKKAAATTVNDAKPEFRCATCQAGFPSKTRLFNHIKDLGHAHPIVKNSKSETGKVC